MILFSVLIPALVALVVMVSAFRWLPSAIAHRHGIPLSVAGAFFVGYWLLPEWAPLQPEQYWHWLPYLGLGGWLLGAVIHAPDVYAVERCAIYGLAAVVSALCLVPTWSVLEPSRAAYITGVSVYLALIGLSLAHLPAVVAGTEFLVSLMLSGLTTAILAAVAVSVKLGQVGIIAAAAMSGCAAAWLLSKRFASPEATRSVALAYAILVGGIGFVAHINASPPMRGLLWPPAAPLLLWLTVCGPLARVSGWPATAIRLGLVLLGLAACAVPLL